jgi:hypothetical protein
MRRDSTNRFPVPIDQESSSWTGLARQEELSVSDESPIQTLFRLTLPNGGGSGGKEAFKSF